MLFRSGRLLIGATTERLTKPVAQVWGVPVEFTTELAHDEFVLLTNVRSDRPPERSILAEAAERVTGGRRDDYGPPALNARRIAKLWDAYLADREGGREAPVEARDVCILMILLKVARESHAPKRDNLIDIAGWAAVLEDTER